MRRMFVGNFEFEHRLSEARRDLPARLARLNAELATSWLALADDGDLLWTPEAVPDGFWSEMSACGFPRVQGVTDWRAADAVLTPWGWTGELLAAAQQRNSREQVPSSEAVKRVNSRRWSAARELEWNIGPEFAAVCTSVDAVAAAIRQLPRSARWVIKSEFAMSGRERWLGGGELTPPAFAWLQRRFAQDRVVFFEPWLNALEEAGLLWDIPRKDPPVFVGLVPMRIDRGQYRGSCIVPESDLSGWQPAIEFTNRAAVEAQRDGYFGPFGVDAMRYRDDTGAERVRPLQDVNARWTMGRLALGWRRFFPEATAGDWWHGPADEFANLLPAPGTSIIRTVPHTIGDAPVQHVSALIVSCFGERRRVSPTCPS